MRNRAPALVAVLAFAGAVALVAGLAGRGGDDDLVKLPVASLGGAGEADTAASASARSALLAPEFGPVEYRLGGDLAGLPQTAPAYRLGSMASTEAVVRLAAALGLDGDVREEDGAWVVRDGSRHLRVERFAGMPWYLGTACPEASVRSDPGTAGPETGSASVVAACGGVVGSTASGGGAGASSPVCDGGGCTATATPAGVAPPHPAPAPAVALACDPAGACPEPAPGRPLSVAPCPPGTTCLSAPTAARPPDVAPVPPDAPVPAPVPLPEGKPARPADLPTRAEAERVARETFTRMGVDLEGFVLDDGWITWEARVEPRVDGRRVVGLGQWLGIGSDGKIVHANGFLARPDRIGDYPLAGVEAGLRRLQDGFGAGPRPLAATDAREGRAVPPGAEPAVDLPAVAIEPAVGGPAIATEPCPADPGVSCGPGPMPAPTPVVRTVTGAHLVLLHLDAVLVPAYVFELDDGGETPPVPAVTDEWLQREAVPHKG